MSEDTGGGRDDSSPYLRLPLPIVAGGLLAFVVLVVVVGLFANRNLRPQPGLVATPLVADLTATPPATAAAAACLTVFEMAPGLAFACQKTAVPVPASACPLGVAASAVAVVYRARSVAR